MNAEDFATQYFDKIFRDLKTLIILSNITIKESIRIKHGIINSLHFTYFRLENPGIHTVTLCCKISEGKTKMWKYRNAEIRC